VDHDVRCPRLPRELEVLAREHVPVKTESEFHKRIESLTSSTISQDQLGTAGPQPNDCVPKTMTTSSAENPSSLRSKRLRCG
jgi:hypothetical protein